MNPDDELGYITSSSKLLNVGIMQRPETNFDITGDGKGIFEAKHQKDLDSNTVFTTFGDKNEFPKLTLLDLKYEDRIRVQKLIEELSDVTGLVGDLQAEIEQKKQRYLRGKTDMSKQMSELERKYMCLTTENKDLRKKYAAALVDWQEKFSSVSDQLQGSTEQLTQLKNKHIKLKSDSEILKRTNSELATKFEALEQEKRHLESTLRSYKLKYKGLKNELKKRLHICNHHNSKEIKNDVQNHHKDLLDSESPTRIDSRIQSCEFCMQEGHNAKCHQEFNHNTRGQDSDEHLLKELFFMF